MTTTEIISEPDTSVRKVAHLVYGLHAFAIVVGIVGSASVVGSFLGSVPSLAGLIFSYVKRSEARGTWLESHYRWQIRTFWFALLWFAIGGILMVTVIGIPIAVVILVAVTLWVIYRIARGWRRLAQRREIGAYQGT